MHHDFLKLLPKATGDSQHVIAVNADIRAFSTFSEQVESVQTALYIKKFYLSLMTSYFKDASFFKPTGDGMLVIFGFEEDTLRARSRAVIASSLRIVRDFPQLLRADPAINFDVPDRLGIGIARGAASRLHSGKKTLDYSGRILNLASRLMDFARPEGIVLDKSFRIDLLTNAQQKLFKEDRIHIRGITTTAPMAIHYTSGLTIIPASARTSPEEAWEVVDVPLNTMKEIIEVGPGLFRASLPSKPADPSTLVGRVRHPSVTAKGTKHPTMHTNRDLAVAYDEVAGEPYGKFQAGALMGVLERAGVKPGWPVAVQFHYRKS